MKKYTEEQFIDAVKNSNNIRQVCKQLGISAYGANYEVVKNKIKKLNLDTTHFRTKPIKHPKIYHFNLDQILVEGSFYENMTNLKRKLIESGYLKEECHNCHRDKYDINGQIIKMPLELHHIDGDRKNNRIQNLILLCPICHTLTKNYCGRNKQVKEYINCSECGKKIRKNKYELCRDCYIKNQNDNTEELYFSEDGRKYFCIKCNKPIKKNNSMMCRKCLNQSKINPNKPSKEILIKQIQEESFLKLGKKYGVSDRTIKNWCDSYNIDHSYFLGGRKNSLQGLKKGHETASYCKKLKQTCPRCGRKKDAGSEICRKCYLEQQLEIKRKSYKQN